MLKQRIIGILIFLSLIVALSSCGSIADLNSTASAEQLDQQEVPQTEESPESAPVDLSGFGKDAEKNLQAAFTDCVGWGETAGSSLDAVIAACDLMGWANDYSVKDSSSTALEAMLDLCYNKMNSDEQQDFRQNWQKISDTADVILTDFESVSEAVEDAGCTERVEMIHTNVNSASNWANLKTGFAMLMAE